MLKNKIQEAMKTAMRAQEKARLAVIRLITAAIKQREVDERIELDDAQVLAVLDKMQKQRRESIEQFQKANRQDLVDQENFELSVIQEFLPEPLSDDDIEKLIAEAIKKTQATSLRDMGKVMAVLKPQIQGRADTAQVSTKIKQQLSA